MAAITRNGLPGIARVPLPDSVELTRRLSACGLAAGAPPLIRPRAAPAGTPAIFRAFLTAGHAPAPHLSVLDGPTVWHTLPPSDPVG